MAKFEIEISEGRHDPLIQDLGEDRQWIKVDDLFDVQIIRTDEGIVIDVYDANDEGYTGGTIATTYAFENELTEPEDRYPTQEHDGYGERLDPEW